jgi:hypothetical protein
MLYVFLLSLPVFNNSLLTGIQGKATEWKKRECVGAGVGIGRPEIP